MGHTVQMLTFDANMDRKQIQKECDMWGDHNCDLEERGWNIGRGLGSPIRFTDRIFESMDEAEEYLKGTIGDYRQTAVRYKSYPKPVRTKAIEAIEKRLEILNAQADMLQKPHYKGVKQATVKCGKCGSTIATKYCGRTYSNNCPVCGAEMRPKSVLDKIEKCDSNIKDLKAKLKEEALKQKKKCSNPPLYWMVCCEVHS